MIGVVLCGGQSSRMGADKGMMAHEDKNWAQIAKEKLESLHIATKISINAAQQNDYLHFFDADSLVLDHPSLAIGGPLKGILSAHLHFSSQDLFVMACDLVKMDAQVFDRLLAQRTKNPDAEAYVFSHDTFFECTCGIYTANGLARIMASYRDGQLQKHGLQWVLQYLETCALPLLPTDEAFFKNFNSPTDLNAL